MPQSDTTIKFTIVDNCKCGKCEAITSPSQCDDISQILYADDRQTVIGFQCWMCDNWITFPKKINNDFIYDAPLTC